MVLSSVWVGSCDSRTDGAPDGGDEDSGEEEDLKKLRGKLPLRVGKGRGEGAEDWVAGTVSAAVSAVVPFLRLNIAMPFLAFVGEVF